MALTLERTGRGLFEKSMTFLTIYIICGFGLLVADSLRGVRGTGVGICFFMKRRIVNDWILSDYSKILQNYIFWKRNYLFENWISPTVFLNVRWGLTIECYIIIHIILLFSPDALFECRLPINEVRAIYKLHFTFHFFGLSTSKQDLESSKSQWLEKPEIVQQKVKYKVTAIRLPSC